MIQESDPNQVYDVLVEVCSAPEGDRAQFVSYVLERRHRVDGGTSEWRFQGALGFGGKYKESRLRAGVDCYPEDLTSERQAMINVANERIRALPSCCE